MPPNDSTAAEAPVAGLHERKNASSKGSDLKEKARAVVEEQEEEMEIDPGTGLKVAKGKGKRNNIQQLLDPRRHSDHKISGLLYIIFFIITVYNIIFNIDGYESSVLLHLSVPALGCLVSGAALRNFKFLPKKSENPGMFAENRTFSYAFVQENMWFQVVLANTYIGMHPLGDTAIPTWLGIFTLMYFFYIREFVPKTSYVSWEQGNEKVNQKTKEKLVLMFINFQVKITRWNYVLKKQLLLYMFTVAAAEWVFGFEHGTWVNQTSRQVTYLLTLDAMHNITTAFFLQTLKFKGFISATTFSFLFNVSPICGVFLTYNLFKNHTFVTPLALAAVVDIFVNLYLIYPSKLNKAWKNRAQVICKCVLYPAAIGYMYHFLGQLEEGADVPVTFL